MSKEKDRYASSTGSMLFDFFSFREKKRFFSLFFLNLCYENLFWRLNLTRCPEFPFHWVITLASAWLNTYKA